MGNAVYGNEDEASFMVGLATVHLNEDTDQERVMTETSDKETNVNSDKKTNEEETDDEMPGLIERNDPSDDEDENEDEAEYDSIFGNDDESEASYVFESIDLAKEYLTYNGKDANEIAAAGVSTTIDTSLLKRNDIWIADSGCTTHMTPHKDGMIKTSEKKEKVTMANGSVEGTNMIGRVVGNKVDMDDNFEHRLVIHDVSHTPGGMFNLFSTGIMIKNGWLLFGNKDILWLQKCIA